MSSIGIAGKTVSRLRDALRDDAFERADRETENVADLIIGALLFGKRDVVGYLHAEVGQLYSQYRASGQGNDLMAGQLRALTTVLAVAELRKRASDPAEMARTAKYHELLEALLQTNQPLTNQELAQRLGQAEGTIARKLTKLREAGLVETRKVWKNNMNSLSESGVAAVRAVPSQNKKAA